MSTTTIRIAALALALTAGAPLALAQSTTSPLATHRQSSQADFDKLTDARIEIVKAALQLTPDQMKYWPAIEQAILTRAKNRQARLVEIENRINELEKRGLVDSFRDRDPIAFLNRRAAALTQRATDLKNLADAWQPLYQTMSPDQKRRMAFLTLYVLHELKDGLEQRLDREDGEEG